MAKNTIRMYLLFSAVSRLSFAFGFTTYVVFLMSRGLNIFQTSLINMVFFFTLFVFEIPTGAIADVFGRKLSFVLSGIITALGFFFYYISQSFWGFALAEATIAIGSTLASGAFQAWLVDKLKYHDYQGKLNKVFSREQMLDGVATIVGGVIGAYLGKFNLAWPWLAGAIGMSLLAIAAQVFMKEEYFVRQEFSWHQGWQATKQVAKDGWQYGVNSKPVRFLILIGTVQLFAVQALNMQWQPYFSKHLNSPLGLGWIFGGFSAFVMMGAWLAPRFSKVMPNEKKLLLFTQLFIGAMILATAVSQTLYLTLSFFIAHEFGRGVFKPLKDQYLNDNIVSNIRATLISFESMSHHIGGFLGLLLAGYLAQVFSINIAWIVSGLILIVASLALAKNGHS